MTKFKGTIRALAVTCTALWAMPAFADTPIVGAGQWMLVDDPAGCWAENNHGVHLKALVNSRGHLVLAAAQPGWHNDFPRVGVHLQVGDETQPIPGTMLESIVMVGIDDAAFQSKILKASLLTWHLPWGDFATPSAGLDKAFAAVTECQSRHS